MLAYRIAHTQAKWDRQHYIRALCDSQCKNLVTSQLLRSPSRYERWASLDSSTIPCFRLFRCLLRRMVYIFYQRLSSYIHTNAVVKRVRVLHIVIKSGINNKQQKLSLTLRRLMSYIYIYIYIYIYGAPILDVSRSHTTASGRSPAEIVGSNPTGGMDICCECRVLSGSGPCDELITRPEESYRLCCVVVCDLETSRMGAPSTYDISSLKVNNLTLILLTWRKWWAPNNASK
jgi:hypothetical protein